MNEKSVYLLAGGGRGSYKEVVEEFLGDLPKKPHIAYIGAPSDDNAQFAQRLCKGLFGETDARTSIVRLAKPTDNIAAAKKILEESDGIFIGGGDPDSGMKILQKHSIASLLKELYRNGAGFIGISAGSIMLGTQWIRGTDPEEGIEPELFECLGLAPVICDCHGEDDGWPDVVELLKLHEKETRVLGITSSAAARVNPDGTIETAVGRLEMLSLKAKRLVSQKL